ncbi:hypothetical protein Bbelb_027310 [Branchiostoma belcheri]|nr:hypothetical protein Bbelb_027310 [Branchiostoma belcheri]
MSLRTLPALTTLFLQGNQLTYVELDIVAVHLPKLKYVNLSLNKLASFSQYALGRPQLTDCGMTHQAETKLQSTENGTFLVNYSVTNTAQSPSLEKELYMNHSSAKMSTIATPTIASTSVKSMGRHGETSLKVTQHVTDGSKWVVCGGIQEVA